MSKADGWMMCNKEKECYNVDNCNHGRSPHNYVALGPSCCALKCDVPDGVNGAICVNYKTEEEKTDEK